MSPNRRETDLSNPLLSMSDDESDIEDMILSETTKKTKKKKIAAIIIMLIVFLASLGGIIYYFFSKKAGVSTIEQTVEVKVQGGVVRGQFESGVVAFKGIPYAKPPVKDLRWKPSVLCEINTCWSGTLDATKFGSMCFQQDVTNIQDPTKLIGSEDCLFINVWTPKKRSKTLLPVLVYIHGGYLLYFSGNWKGLHPTPEMVLGLDIVGVSFNYRLNAFGFLSLKSLADASPTKSAGNYGFMDQILALKWVQRNIEKFGGDPASVTLIGQSSGGTSELALLASPSAAGLFHGAIVMSASPVFNKSSEDAAIDNEIFVKHSKCERNSSADERECLYSLTPKQIEDAIPWDVYPYWRMADLMDLPTKNHFDGAVAVVDKTIVAQPPLVAMESRKANDVPLIIGTTAQEINISPVKTFGNSAFRDYKDHVEEKLRPFLGNDVDEALSMYNESLAESGSLQFAYSSMVSDLRETCPTNVLALNASKGFKSPVYRYVITNSPSAPINVFGYPASLACHIWDQVAFFGFPAELKYTPSEKDKRFMKDLRRQFGEFIHKGTVKDNSWKRYPESTALFTNDGVTVIKEDYHKKECDFWLKNGFFSYGWIN